MLGLLQTQRILHIDTKTSIKADTLKDNEDLGNNDEKGVKSLRQGTKTAISQQDFLFYISPYFLLSPLPELLEMAKEK